MVAGLALALCCTVCGTALADAPAGNDPASNFHVGSLPAACDTDPMGAVCIGASLDYLNQARASLGQPRYTVPADFANLRADEQVLILTNSDRTLYNLSPMTGVTAELDHDAAATLATDADPQPSTPDWQEYTSNSSWGDDNVVLAYGGWMYDDGPGSNNVDCSPSTPSGCWIHRHDILWQFDPGRSAIGVATGTDSKGNSSYTMLLMVGNSNYAPAYTYTWDEAMADGARAASGGTQGATPSTGPAGGQKPSARGARAGIRIRTVRVRGHRLTVRFTGSPGTSLRCSLVRAGGHLRRAKRCARRVSFKGLPSGRYRFRVRSRTGMVTRRVHVR
jgi:hypothetical protein